MWDWHWQPPADYGTRYDFGLIETPAKFMRSWAEHNQRQPAIGWIASKLFGRFAYNDMPKMTEVVDQREWVRSEGHDIGGVGELGKWELTRGGIAACWAIVNSKAGDSVVLVGCDFLRDGVTLPADQAFAPVYIANPGSWGLAGYVAGVSKSGNHDFPAERTLIERMAAKRRVTVAFAQDAWTGAESA